VNAPTQGCLALRSPRLHLRSHEPYRGTHDFAIIRFRSVEGAARLVGISERLVKQRAHGNSGEGDGAVKVAIAGPVRATCRAELLNPAWLLLAGKQGRRILSVTRRAPPATVSDDSDAGPASTGAPAAGQLSVTQGQGAFEDDTCLDA
jgi:hypothetical protein